MKKVFDVILFSFGFMLIVILVEKELDP